MSAREHLGNIVLGIKTDLSRCEKLLPLLTEQQRLLSRHDSEGLAPVGAAIDLQVQALADSARDRVSALRALGVEPDQKGVQTLIQKLPATLSEQLRDLWRQLEIALSQCQALNERNGELLAHQRMALAELIGSPLNHYGETR